MRLLNIHNFTLVVLVLNCSLCLISAGILSHENIVKRPLDTQTSNTFEDESLRKNDDAHLRLFYKSNSQGRSVSHELEHRLVKNPEFQFNQRPLQQQQQQQLQQPQQQIPYQPKFNTQFDLNYFDPRNSLPLTYNQNMPIDQNKNRQTLFNLHYHGNSLGGLDNSFNQLAQVQQQQQQQLQQQQQEEMQRKAQRANLLRMLLLNMSPNQQQMAPMPQPVPQFEQPQQSKNDLQYKIVHLKFKIEPQMNRILGQGYVETDNGAGSLLNSKQFSILPREIPELIKRLIVNVQAQNQANQAVLMNNLQRGSILKKRGDDDLKSSFSDESNLEKRDDEIEMTSQTTEQSAKRVKKTALKSDEEDKINDTEFTESFKSLQRRDDSEYSSLAENEDMDRQMLLRSEEQDMDTSRLNDSFEMS
ncbi:unnamed protein product [Brachionus calyciflorus]|uniref:Uncharacterized protein n=1 Tax=Brachionus calyciflorus TaxID=104777 RepID=A0A814IUP1_9BILA|nr:unnamed protein product [Brachionus calyciflorus]